MSAARLAFLALTLVNLSCTSKAPRAKEPPMIERLIGVNITNEAGYAT